MCGMTATISKNTIKKNNWNSSEKKCLNLQPYYNQIYVVFQHKFMDEIFYIIIGKYLWNS